MSKVIIKTTAAVMTLCLLLPSVGCSSGSKELNAKRGSNYQFDVVDYIDIDCFGQNGEGYVRIAPKDITKNDFSNDEDYINVKKDLTAMDISYLSGSNSNSGVKVKNETQNSNNKADLSNGDVLQISFNYSKSKKNSDINTETYEYQVDGLSDLNEVDIFDDAYVKFYATSDGKLHYVKQISDIPSDVMDNIEYKVDKEDASDALTVDQSILKVSASLVQDSDASKEFYDVASYLASKNIKAKNESEKVLEYMAEPIDFSNTNSIALEKALYSTLKDAEGDTMATVNNVQRATSAAELETDGYAVGVVYTTNDGNNPQYWYRDMDVATLEGSPIVIECGERRQLTEKDAGQATYGKNIVMTFDPTAQITQTDGAASSNDTGTDDAQTDAAASENN